VEVSLKGVKGKFPNGNDAFLWSHGRVTWENGALLSVINGLGYPDAAAGSNDQGMVLYCEGDDQTGLIFHDDHNRGVAYSYLEGIGPGGSKYNYVSPDFYRLIPWEGPGYKPIGYGYESVGGLPKPSIAWKARWPDWPPMRRSPGAGKLSTKWTPKA